MCVCVYVYACVYVYMYIYMHIYNTLSIGLFIRYLSLLHMSQLP